jgi:hypothetical protein
MKKTGYVFLFGVLVTFLCASAWADTIDKLSLADNILNINGAYFDAWAGEYNPTFAMWDGEIGRI